MFSALPEWISPQLAAPPPPARAAHTATRPPVTLNDADKTPVREHAYVCDVCRKTFKRETNLMFHMATHRSRVIDAATGIAVDQKWDAPTSCSCCSRVFATKYQAKKHFLRKHFVGEKMYACDICKVKAFAVKEDWSMHTKSCGRLFPCACGLRLRSQATLKRHCRSSGDGHAPVPLDGALLDLAADGTTRPHAGRAPQPRARPPAKAGAHAIGSEVGPPFFSSHAGGEEVGEEESDFEGGDDDEDDEDGDDGAWPAWPPLLPDAPSTLSCDGDVSRASFETRAHQPNSAGGGGCARSTTTEATAATAATDCTDCTAPVGTVPGTPPPPFIMPAQLPLSKAARHAVAGGAPEPGARKRKGAPVDDVAQLVTRQTPSPSAIAGAPLPAFFFGEMWAAGAVQPPMPPMPAPPPFQMPACDDAQLLSLFAFFSGAT
ncbi:hypothetical protein KFE25_001178 [Diacronema lutheri]|uniref:C2H2-type domain-containing protein n=2 Tax=Diacronema lutheri TaxID=2081491 RepID=A0A8J6C617_DIALT|nr:hypothetical protein KFE25_001178 [Diacronema lutheri]